MLLLFGSIVGVQRSDCETNIKVTLTRPATKDAGGIVSKFLYIVHRLTGQIVSFITNVASG